MPVAGINICFHQKKNISLLQFNASMSLKKTSTKTKGGELLSLLRSNLSHVQCPRLQIQVYQVRLHLICQLDYTDYSALANHSHWWCIQQRDLIGVQLHNNKIFLVRCQSDREGCILREAAPPCPQPVPSDGVKSLDPFVAPVGHPHSLGVVHSQAVGDVELSRALSFLCMHPQDLLLFG